MEDIRDVIFKKIIDKRFRAYLTAERTGVLSGREMAERRAEELGVRLEFYKKDGDEIVCGDQIGYLIATPRQIAAAEEQVIGTLAKFSGIATAAREAVRLADGRARIVSGSWKKMPPEIKDMVRQAVTTGGASFCIAKTPMIYLDKNYIRMLGSVSAALMACTSFSDRVKVIQIRGEEGTVAQETGIAVQYGAGILMVDTGSREDLAECLNKLSEMGVRDQVEVAFAGNVALSDISELSAQVDVLCIGKEIVDARLLDLKLDVVGEEK